MYFLEQKVPIICLQPFLETIRFVIFRTDINFSKGNHMFLESECLRGEQVAVHSDSYINKKVIRFFFFQVKHYQVYHLERSKAFFQWQRAVSIRWFSSWITVYKMSLCISVFRSGKSQFQPLSDSLLLHQPEHQGRDRDTAYRPCSFSLSSGLCKEG